MTTREKDYVRAVYTFQGESPTDLTLQIGDVVCITEVLDAQWAKGQKLGQTAEGIFPVNYVEPLKLPSYRTGQKLFVALQNFESEQPGDLELTKGDVILGTEKVDESWWKGKNGPLKGIFPLTFAVELEQHDGPRSRSASARSNSLKSRANSLVDNSGRTKLQETAFARALVDVQPQLDGELAFQMGDMIEVTEIMDEDWMFGRCRNKEGLISSVCVELLDEGDSGCESNINSSFEAKVQDHVQDLIRPGNRNSQSRPRTSTEGSYTSENTRSHDAEVTPYGEALFPFVAQLPSELSLEEGQLVNLIQHIDSDWTKGEIDGKRGVFPSNFIEVIVDCPYAISNDEVAEKEYPSQIYDYEHVEHENELNKSKDSSDKSDHSVGDFGKEETLEEASLAGKEKKSKNSESKTNGIPSGVTASVSEVFVMSANHEIGLVCHSFKASVEGDVSVNEGDTVEVIRKVDKNWVQIQLESGEKGVVPINHIEIIGSWPREDSESSIKQTSSEKSQGNLDLDAESELGSKTDGQSKDSPRDIPEIPALEKSKSALLESERGTDCRHMAPNLKPSVSESSGGTPVVQTSQMTSPQGNKSSTVSKPFSKPATKPKPPIAPKPTIARKPLVIKLPHLYTAKPFSTNAARASHVVSPTEKRKEMILSLDSLIEGEISKAKSRSSSSNSDSSSEHKCSFGNSQQSHDKGATIPSLKDTSSFKPTEPLSVAVSSEDRSSENQISKELLVKKEDIVAFDPASSKPDVVPSRVSRPKRPLLTVSHSLPEDVECSKAISSNKRASIGVVDSTRKVKDLKLNETGNADSKPNIQAVLSSSSKDSSFINKAFEMDVAEGDLIGEVNRARNVSPLRRKPIRAPPPRPKSAIYPSSFDVVPTANSRSKRSRSPPPRPTGPRLAAAPSKAPLVPVRVDDGQSKPRPVPQRPAPRAPVPARSAGQGQKNSTEAIAEPIAAQPKRQIVPARKAPPRPTTVSVGPVHGSSNQTDLMQFSPEKAQEDDESTKEMIADLKARLAENTADIKKYEQNRQQFQSSLDLLSLSDTSNDDSNSSSSCHFYCQDRQKELQDSLQFVDSTLHGLREEQHDLKDNLLSFSGSEERTERSRLILAQQAEDEKKKKDEAIQHEVAQRVKRLNQRNRVINEIIETEKDYLFSLHLCLETFLDVETPPPPGLDVDFLLGNTEEIADVSQKILLNLESNVTGKAIEDQCIGVCFTATAEDMKNTYAPYCRNHDEVIKSLGVYGESEEISEYLNSKVEKMKEQMNLFDVSSLLIKPVQRILKYPLLLNELLQSTEDGHQDKQGIIAAIKAMTDVAKAINEYKRRKDLVYKYKRSSDERFSDKIAKLNLHSIKKKSTRMRGRLSTNFGMGLQLKDEGFEKEEARFRSIEKAVKTFLSSTNRYIEQSQEAMQWQENLVDGIVQFYREKECVEVEKFHQVNLNLLDLYVKMKSTITETVVVPLTALVKLFNAPTQVIGKRFDKLLDYNHQLGRVGDNEKELKATKNDYEAMNAQLMDELPKFFNITFNLLQHCMSAFVQARRDFMDQSLKESCALLELPSMISKEHMMEIFKIRHTTAFDHMSMLNFIPRGFNPKVDTVKVDRARQRGKNAISDAAAPPALIQTVAGGQSDKQRTYLYQTYPPEKLYTVTITHSANDLLDISLTEGTIVGVVKELDPMGNKDRWYVDDGATKGFAPSSALSKGAALPPAGTTPTEEDVLSIHSYDSNNAVDANVVNKVDNKPSHSTLVNSAVASVPLQTMESSSPQLQPSHDAQQQYYYALYDFQGRHANEASLTAGTPVTVLAFEDSDGNSEWWLVESDGNRGYSPANYMAPMPYS